MTIKSAVPNEPKKPKDDAHPGMMGDGTEEQNLDQPGNPGARITKEDADAAFGKAHPAKSK
jgi:hypothetical protein